MSNPTTLQQLRLAASRAQGYAADVAGAAASAIETLDGQKADKSKAVAFTIPTTGWGTDDVIDYPNYYDLAVTGVTALDRATISISPTGMNAAIECGMCPTSETLAGKIRIRAAEVPAEAISAEYWLDQGKE